MTRSEDAVSAASPRPATFRIGDHQIGSSQPAFIIAEIGVNHEGDVETCARMIDALAASGADAMKLQTVDADASYVRGTASHDIFSTSALGREQTAAMFAHARTLGLMPFTTAGDMATLEWVDRLDPVAHKISSGLLTHLPMVRAAAETGRPLIMSTGMAREADIDEAVAAARSKSSSGLALLQCTSLYPAPEDRVNLSAMATLVERYNAPVGFSDHTLSTDVAAYAVTAGAVIIEKHFTLDPSREGFDHKISLNPEQFFEMVRQVRRAELLRGKPEKYLSPEETEMRSRSHRILVAARAIAVGELLVTGNVACKRPLPGTVGLPPSALDDVLGRQTLRALKTDEPIIEKDIQP